MSKNKKSKVIKVKDQPRFNLILKYEKEFKKEYATIFGMMMDEIKKKIKA